MVVSVPLGDGTYREATLAEIVDKYRRPDIPDDDLKLLELVKKSAKGDVDANRALVEHFLPAKPAAVPAPNGQPTDKIAALEAQVSELKRMVGEGIAPTVTEIQEMRDMSLIDNFVGQLKDALPYTARAHEKGLRPSQMIYQAFKSHVSQFTPEQQRDSRLKFNVLKQAAAAIENHFASMQAMYDGFVPPNKAAAAPQPGKTAVDDQGRPQSGDGRIPGMYQLENGVLVDVRGRPVAQDRSGHFANIPSEPVSSVPSGPVPAGRTDNNGPLTKNDLISQMRDRKQQLRALEAQA